MPGELALRPVLVTDPDVRERRKLARLLAQAGYETREAGTAAEAIAAARDERPELTIIEVCLPELCGYELCRELRDLYGDLLPIIFTSATRIEPIDLVAGLLLGGDDYVVKPWVPDELLARVRALIRRSTPAAPQTPAIGSDLTKRELEILRLLAEGLEPDEIAQKLAISSKTVSTHVQNVFRKLGVRSRPQALAAAYRLDLVPLPAHV
jgi:DNA-binding NarL/FixJ family response regulator